MYLDVQPFVTYFGDEFENLTAALDDSAYSHASCVPGYKPYSPWVDFIGATNDPNHIFPDALVSTPDFSFWTIHYNHHYTAPQTVTAEKRNSAMGQIHVDFQEEQPLIGERRLHATVRLAGVPPFKAMMISLRNENPVFRFDGWSGDPTYSGTTMCAQVPHDGQQQIMIGVANASETGGDIVLGSFDVGVMTNAPVEFGVDDFALIFADILTDESTQYSIYGEGQSFARTFAAPRFVTQLAQNYPNPFNPNTTIAFSLAEPSHVSLRVFDVSGRSVRTLVDGLKGVGVHRISWDGRNQHGARVASGVYIL